MASCRRTPARGSSPCAHLSAGYGRRLWSGAGDASALRGARLELEVREQLDEVEGNDGDGLVVLTPLENGMLGDDVVARFPRARLEQTDRWSALRGAFRARDVDPRLRAHRWLADLLWSASQLRVTHRLPEAYSTSKAHGERR